MQPYRLRALRTWGEPPTLPLLMRRSVAIGLPGVLSSGWQQAADEPGPEHVAPPQLMRLISAAIDYESIDRTYELTSPGCRSNAAPHR